MDLKKKITIEIVDCYPYDLTKQKGFISVANDMLVEYIRESKKKMEKIKRPFYILLVSIICAMG